MKQSVYDAYVPTPLRRRRGEVTLKRAAKQVAVKRPRIRIVKDRLARIDKSPGPNACWPWTGPRDRDGYGLVKGVGMAHRLVFEGDNGYSLAPGDVVRHKCDNPACCNPAHLLVGTQVDNVLDRVQRDRSAKGAENGRAKLSEEQVKCIYESADPVRVLGLRFDVDESTVRSIKHAKTWRWLTKSYSKRWNKPVSFT